MRRSSGSSRGRAIAYIVAVLDTYGRATGGLLANGLAFAALFTAVPIMLLTLGLTGFLAEATRRSSAPSRTRSKRSSRPLPS